MTDAALGAYRLVERLAVGGMAEVFRAERPDAPDRGVPKSRWKPLATHRILIAAAARTRGSMARRARGRRP